ncbi:MAG TPA: hypothetical protein VLL54_15475 [Pyrinomonadaceae bacterium]|nr:hypothetical protein [Pyrinomonadaceae bacterium]
MAMPGWGKALIIVGALLLLLVVLIGGVIGAGAWWWSNNKDKVIAGSKAAMDEGVKAGRETDNQGCVDQSITRYKSEPGFVNGISTSLFMQGCLNVSKPTPGFCDDVPGPTEFIKTGQWEVRECRDVGLESDQYCRQLFQTKQRFCLTKKAIKDTQVN